MTVSLSLQPYVQSRAFTRRMAAALENLLADLLTAINGAVAPANAQYLTLATHAELSAERTLALTAGHMTAVDAGANGAYTLSLASTGVTAASYGGAGTAPSLTVDAQGRLTAAATVTLVQDAISDSVTTIAPSQNAVFDALALKQPLDATLTALAALDATVGIVVLTGADTFARRTLQAPAAGLTITNPAGTAGDMTFALADDLAALEALGTTGIARRTGANTWSLGGVSWSEVSGTPTTLAGYGITDAQPLDATLTALAGANWAANAIPIGSGADTLAQVSFAANTFPARASTGDLAAKTITDFGLSLVDDANASAARTTLGLAIGTDVQAYDAELAAIAGLTSAADRLPYFTGLGTASLATFTAAGRALVDDADASAQRTTLGLGTAAVQNTGTSGATLPFCNGANTWSAAQVINLAANYGLQLTGATTDFRGILMSNTGATTVFGIEKSAGGQFITGSPGYSTAIVTFDANPILFGVNNTERGRITSTGFQGAVGATTPNTGAFTTLAITEGAVVPGKYKPTLTNVTNVAASSDATDSFSWHKTGDTITAAGVVNVTPTIGGAVTELAISLPVASDFANAHECVGHHGREPTVTLPVDMGIVVGDVTNNRARLIWVPSDTTASNRYVHFTYRII